MLIKIRILRNGLKDVKKGYGSGDGGMIQLLKHSTTTTTAHFHYEHHGKIR